MIAAMILVAAIMASDTRRGHDSSLTADFPARFLANQIAPRQVTSFFALRGSFAAHKRVLLHAPMRKIGAIGGARRRVQHGHGR
jgi:hypothetical protein